jgi:hypothetical protein
MLTQNWNFAKLAHFINRQWRLRNEKPYQISYVKVRDDL